jgi:phage tail sheath gpL-like
MAINTGVAANWQLPLFWATVDGSQAGNLTQSQPALLIGQMTTVTIGTQIAGTSATNILTPIGSPALAASLFGQGSMLARMIKAFFAVNVNQLLYAIAVPDPGAGVQATGTITVVGTATAAGTLFVYIAGQLVQVAVASGDTPTIQATNLAAAINAIPSLPVQATPSVGVVTCTCNWKGLTGNDITCIPNYLGGPGGQFLPAGVTLTIATPWMTGGTGSPVFTTAIAAIQSLSLPYVGMPYNDSGSESTWATEYGFGATGRWAYSRQQYGYVVDAYRDTFANSITRGLGTNSPVISSMAIEQLAPSPIWEWTAAYAGLAANSSTDDPAQPMQTLEMVGILPAQSQFRYSQAQLNSLSLSGFAIQATAPDGNPMIMREQTQYQLNSFGQGDTAFGLLTVLATLAFLLNSMKSAITSKYARVKLVPDGTAYGPGQAIVAPNVIKAELVSEFVTWQTNGLVANMQQFINNLVVQIDTTNPNRVNVLWPPQLAGQLRIFAVLAQFRLLYPPNIAGQSTQVTI